MAVAASQHYAAPSRRTKTRSVPEQALWLAPLLTIATLFFLWPVINVIRIAFTDTVLLREGRENIPTWLRALALIIVLSTFGWASIARLLRGQVLGLREREFVEAAKVTGASPKRIVFKELLPNLWTPIIIQSRKP